MKTLLLFAAIALSINVFGQSTVKIGNLEVMTEDLEGSMKWDEALRVCADLGDGWRLPTIEELNTLYQNKDEIGGFTVNDYWSSTEYNMYNRNDAWRQNFFNGLQYNSNVLNGTFSVRAVRTSKSSKEPIQIVPSAQDIKTIKIDNFEVMSQDLGEMTMEEAVKACADLGDGWRLPVRRELNILFRNNHKIGGDASKFYLSSVEDGYAWVQSFYNGFEQWVSSESAKGFTFNVRAVRD